MIIRKLIANYGNLENETLSLDEGLNIVTLPNEAGKSTWSSFLLSMLYGVDTAQKDRQDRLADKNRFDPWTGGRMSGAMELEFRGRGIRIERGGSGDAMRGFKALYIDSGDNVPGMDAENAGEILTGASRAVYERSAFIRQDGIPVDPSPELEIRLQTLVSTQDGSATYSDAQKRMRDWQREIKHNKNSELPRLEAEIAEQERRVSALEQKGELLADARARLRKSEQELNEARQEVENHRLLEDYDRSRELARARMELLKAENTIKQSGYRPIDRANLRALERSEIDVRSLKAEAERLGREKSELLEKCANVEVQIPAVFRGLTPADAENRAVKDTAEYAALSAVAAGKMYIMLAALLFALFAALCAAAFFSTVGVYAIVPAAVMLAAAIVIFVSGRKRAARAAAGAMGLQAAYGTTDFVLLANKYVDESRRATEEAQRCGEVVERYENARARADEAEKALLDAASRILGGRGTLEELAPALQAAMESVAQNESLTQKYEAAKALVESLARTQKDDSGKYELKNIPQVKSTAQQAAEVYSAAQAEKERLMRAVSQLEGELTAAGDADVHRARLLRLKARRETAAEEFEALELALEALSEADAQLRRRFSPILNEKAGAFFHDLTGGRYKALYVEKSFSAGATEHDGTVSRDRRSLSTGTVSQMYLAVRLAMCTMLGETDDLPPLVLDDALCTFDDTRMGLALETLLKIAKERQVILFTCHSREEAYIKTQL